MASACQIRAQPGRFRIEIRHTDVSSDRGGELPITTQDTISVDGYAEIPYNGSLRFEWDEDKNEANQRKHGVPFETALRVFADPHCLLFVERIQDGEERWHAIGAVRDTFFLTVVHTYREDGKANEVVRVVSARPATRSEVKLYVKSNYGG